MPRPQIYKIWQIVNSFKLKWPSKDQSRIKLTILWQYDLIIGPKVTKHTVTAASEIVHKKKYPSIGSWTRDLEVTSSTLWHWAKKFFLKKGNFSCDFNHLVKILWRKMSNLMSNLEKIWKRKFLKIFLKKLI